MSKPTDERFTPEEILSVVREFGRIELDVCTTRKNPVRAASFYTKTEDGLAAPWHGLSWGNYPYSRGQLLRWAHRAHAAWEGSGVEHINLVPADTSTVATSFMLRHAHAVAFWNRRIRFTGAAGAKFANASFYWGERQGRFQRVFSPHATVLVLR